MKVDCGRTAATQWLHSGHAVSCFYRTQCHTVATTSISTTSSANDDDDDDDVDDDDAVVVHFGAGRPHNTVATTADYALYQDLPSRSSPVPLCLCRRVVSSKTDLDDGVVDVTSFSALDVIEI